MNSLKNRIWKGFLVAAFVGVSWSSAAEQSIGSVDMIKVFDAYWKTKQADAKLKERQDGFQAARKTLVEEFETANEEYQKLLQEANNQAVTQDARNKKKQDAEAKLLDLREIQNSVDQFDRQAVTTLEDQKKRARNDIVREITELVVSIAKQKSYSFVLDVSGFSHNQTPIVLYTDGSNDLSDQLIEMLNANAPAQYMGNKATSKPPAP